MWLGEKRDRTMTKSTVESNWNPVSDDEWEAEDVDSLKDRFSDWIDRQIDQDADIRCTEKDGKLYFSLDDIVLTNPDYPNEMNLLVTVNKIESLEKHAYLFIV